MNKKEFAEILKTFFRNYNKRLEEVDAGVINNWYEALKDYDVLYVKKGIAMAMVKEKYLPNLATIIEYIKEVPEIIISEEEKIRRWKEKGIIPKWLEEKDTLLIEEK